MPEERWRVVRFEDGFVDFTHEREWRLRGDLDFTQARAGFYLLVETVDEANKLRAMGSPVANSLCGILPMGDLRIMI
jgi:hypothetical protein